MFTPAAPEIREEFCWRCGRRRPVTKLNGLCIASTDQEANRQYQCRRELPCMARQVWRAHGRLAVLFDDAPADPQW
jgi:hypothetical protein